MDDFPDAAACGDLAHDLEAAGYTSDALRAAWGAEADLALGHGLREPAERALRARGDALATVGLLLGLGIALPDSDVRAAFPHAGVSGLAALRLVDPPGDGEGTVSPRALIRPQAWTGVDEAGEWWIASDLDEAALGGRLPEDHVLGAGGASLTLAGIQLPTPAHRVLDVGAGCGIQSLRARLFADEVTATDISARALWFTQLNAQINGVAGIHPVAGSLFEPVVGQQFDRVISNPPFVITPRVHGVPTYEYRDGGLVGDGLVERFVREVGSVLEPGGVAQLLGNWETRDGLDGLARLHGWIDSSEIPLDAWIIERERLDPLAYAELWVRDGGTAPGSPEYARLIDAWLADFATRGVTSIGFGYILLRRPQWGAPTLSRYEPVETSGTAPAVGPDLARALAVHDMFAGWDDTTFGGMRFTVAPDVTEARHHQPGAEAPSIIELRQGRGFGRTVIVDPGTAGVVGACDGELTLRQLIYAVADLLDVDGRELAEEMLPTLRELAFIGMLDPVPEE